MTQTKPNVIVIQTESQDGRLLGCLGHPAMVAATPHLDRMAAEGVIFENHYCNYLEKIPRRGCEHGQYIKLTHFEVSSRIPLIVRGPGVPAGERIRTPASLTEESVN